MQRTQATLTLGDQTDLAMVYEDMKHQFPPEELYPMKPLTRLVNNNQYKILLYRRDEDNRLVAYALVYTIESCNLLWLDYIAVLDEFKDHGYGSALFQAIVHKYCGPFDGMLFSVEHVCNNNPKLAQLQRRRLEFYKKLGAHRLQAEFLLPTDGGSLPMFLYFMPRPGVSVLSREAQIQAITQMYDYCFFYLKHRSGLLAQYKQTVQDEILNG